MPFPEIFDDQPDERERYAVRAGKLAGLAAETFNDGLRAYYFAFALIAWFMSPLALMAGAVLVVAILYSREFRSDVLHLLDEGD
jgi:uncharacterized membrane protein